MSAFTTTRFFITFLTSMICTCHYTYRRRLYQALTKARRQVKTGMKNNNIEARGADAMTFEMSFQVQPFSAISHARRSTR